MFLNRYKFINTNQFRAKDGVVEIHKDQGLAENPMDRVDEKLTAKVKRCSRMPKKY